MSWKKKLIAGTALAAATTITIHVINKMISLSATLDDLLGGTSGSFYEWKFGKIYYETKGTGSPILLIHDLTTYSSACEWSKVYDKLAESHTVYAIDLLGCGRSEKPNITYTNYLYVQLISDFIKHVIGQKTDVIATGESGAFCIAACHNDNTIINHIMMVNPMDIQLLTRIPSKRTKTLKYLINIPVIGTFLYNMLTRRSDIQMLFETEYFADPLKVEEKIVKTYYESAHTDHVSSKYLFASLAGYYTTININHCLESMTNSIFILTGKSNSDYKEYALKYQQALPSVELLEIEDAAYLPQLEQPDAFIEQVHVLFTEEEPL